MKRFFCLSGSCIGAALTLAASGAQAQTAAPIPPGFNPYTQAPASPQIIPGTAVPVIPPAPSIDPMPRMPPVAGVAPIPNLAPAPGQQPAQRMAPMPTRPLPPESKPRQSGSEAFKFVLPIRPYDRSQLFVVPSPAPTPDAALSRAPRPDTMIVDGDFLYILRGDTLVKVDKKTLKVMESTTLPALSVPALPNTLTVPRLKPWSNSAGTHFGIGPAF